MHGRNIPFKMPHSTTNLRHPYLLLPLLLLLLLSPQTVSTQTSTSTPLPTPQDTTQNSTSLLLTSLEDTATPSVLTQTTTISAPSSMMLTQTPIPSFSSEAVASSGLVATSALGMQSSPSSSTSSPVVTTMLVEASSTSMEVLIVPTPTLEGPRETPTESSTDSLLLPVTTIIGLAVGGASFLILCLLCLFCCWRCFCYINPKDRRYYVTSGAEMRVTTQYWTEGSAHYTVRRQDSLISRASSIRSSLGLRPKVHKNRYSNGDHVTYENQAAPQFYSTPL